MATGTSHITREDFDFLRFSWTDIHGISKTVLVSRKNVQRFWEDGLQIALGPNAFGPNGEFNFVPEVIENGFANGSLQPIPETLHPVPWAGSEGSSVGQVLLGWHYMSGQQHPADPRAVATRLMDTLDREFGFTVMSAFEYEFTLLDGDSKEPVYQPCDICTTLTISQFEDFLIKTDGYLSAAGIEIESYHTDAAPGQFEMATIPKLGIEAMDQAFKFKQSMKEISRKAGYVATFMTRPMFKGLSNAGHFNVSLWNNNHNENVLHDPNDKDRMSSVFKHWIAGLIKHTNALTAICCPTVNCYRRLHQGSSHKKADWGIDNRRACYRAKAYNPKATYLELRFPTSPANPYMVMASVLAAGMDGLRNKLELPQPLCPDATQVPQTLAEALGALEQDDVIKEAIGPVFVEWFLQEKRQVEIEAFKTHSVDNRDEDELAAERKMYLTSI